MNKKSILITGLSILSLLLLLYLVLSSKLVTVKPDFAVNNADLNALAKKTPVDQQKLEDSYKSYVRTVITEFEGLLAPYFGPKETVGPLNTEVLASGTKTIESNETENKLSELSKLKIGLMDVTVPEGYQNLHIELMKLFTGARDYLEEHDDSVKNNNLAMLKKIKLDYPWINE